MLIQATEMPWLYSITCSFQQKGESDNERISTGPIPILGYSLNSKCESHRMYILKIPKLFIQLKKTKPVTGGVPRNSTKAAYPLLGILL